MNDLLNRFVGAVENIGNALQVIASNQTAVTDKATVEGPAPTPAAEGKEPKPRATRTTKADTKPADSAPAAAAAAAAAADPTPESAKPAKPETPPFDYEELKKAIIALASAGDAGKEAATRILTDAGLSRGQKASEAPAAKWPGMHKQAVDALAALNSGTEFA